MRVGQNQSKHSKRSKGMVRPPLVFPRARTAIHLSWFHQYSVRSLGLPEFHRGDWAEISVALMVASLIRRNPSAHHHQLAFTCLSVIPNDRLMSCWRNVVIPRRD